MTKRKYKTHKKEELEKAIKDSETYAEVLRKLNLKPVGGNYDNLKNNIRRFNIDISHMKHKSCYRELKTFDDLKTNKSIVNRLVKEKGHICEMCGNFEWLGQKIMLELDHIDGDNMNNSRENLRIICPNCHSTTPTWRNRKRK